MTIHTPGQNAHAIATQLREKGIVATVPKRVGANIVRTLNWLLIDLVAKGLTVDAAETALTDALKAQACDLRRAGIL
jgi:hypothetical protein